MAALNSLNLIYDVTNANKNGLLLNFSTAQPGIIPSFFRNDGITVSSRSVQPSATTSRAWDDVDLSADTVVLAIGAFDKSPDSGSWYLQSGINLTSGLLVTGNRYQIVTYLAGDNFSNVGAASNATGAIFTATGTTPTTWTNSSVLQEITPELAYNVSAASLQSSLNATAWINSAGGVTASSSQSGSYSVQFTNPGPQSTMAGFGGFSPASSISIYSVVAGSSSVPALQLIEIVANPYAFTATWTSFPAASAVVTTIAEGSSSTPNVQRVTLTPAPYAGTVQLTTSLLTTAAIAVPASILDVQNALNTGGTNYIVTGSTGGPYTITTVVNGSVAAITVNTTGLLVPTGLQGTLNLSTYGMLQAFLDAGTSTLNLILEIQVTPSAGYPSTVLQLPVVVSKNVINLSSLVPAPLPSLPALILSIIGGNVATPSGPTDFSTLPGGVIPTGNQVFFADRDLNSKWTISKSDAQWKILQTST
jgi:hypothetical protein